MDIETFLFDFEWNLNDFESVFVEFRINFNRFQTILIRFRIDQLDFESNNSLGIVRDVFEIKKVQYLHKKESLHVFEFEYLAYNFDWFSFDLESNFNLILNNFHPIATILCERSHTKYQSNSKQLKQLLSKKTTDATILRDLPEQSMIMLMVGMTKMKLDR